MCVHTLQAQTAGDAEENLAASSAESAYLEANDTAHNALTSAILHLQPALRLSSATGGLTHQFH